MNEMKTLPLAPPGWGNDSLSAFLETAHHNRMSTFVQKKDWYQRLAGIDACYALITKDWQDPEDKIAALFFVRALGAFRAACEHALAGQVAEIFPEARTCIEIAGYALHIHKNPALGEIWLKRHDDVASKKASKNQFTPTAVRGTIEKANRKAAEVYADLYQLCIDLGAHPNERSLTRNMRITQSEDGSLHEQVLLHSDGLSLEHGLKTAAQAGVCALEIFQEIFGKRFDRLGVRAELLQLRRGLYENPPR